jgi:hypothetical protein
MNSCTHCGSYAINPASHGRKKDADLDLCDVCYWRKRAEVSEFDLLQKKLYDTGLVLSGPMAVMLVTMLRGAIADMEKKK